MRAMYSMEITGRGAEDETRQSFELHCEKESLKVIKVVNVLS